MTAIAFEYSIRIFEDDIDQHGHVNNVVYLKWVQEAAAAHWNANATEDMKKEHFWVVVRHEIDYLSPCFLSRRLLAKTWVGEVEGAKSQRLVDIYDLDTNKIIARVKTDWILLDASSKRPKRITADFMKHFKPE